MGWYTFVRFFGLRGENVKAIAWVKSESEREGKRTKRARERERRTQYRKLCNDAQSSRRRTRLGKQGIKKNRKVLKQRCNAERIMEEKGTKREFMKITTKSKTT